MPQTETDPTSQLVAYLQGTIYLATSTLNQLLVQVSFDELLDSSLYNLDACLVCVGKVTFVHVYK